MKRASPFAHRKSQHRFTVRLIDAEEFRNRSLDCQEFGCWATHIDYPDIIPEGEIWIDKDSSETDKAFYLRTARAEQEASDSGKNEDDAYDYALAVDRSERERETEGGDGARPAHDEIPQDIYVDHLGTFHHAGEDLDVWLVDGEKVRAMYKSDFTEGGNAFVYPWMPKQEIWIESNVSPSERQFVILHEATERQILRDEKMGYEDAHDAASKVEFAARQQQSKSLDQNVAEAATDIGRARRVDLVTLPDNIKGTNCGNCRFVSEGFCTHSEVRQQVNSRMCCALWDADGVQRAWELSEKRTNFHYNKSSFSDEKLDTKALSAFSETSGGALTGTPRRVRKSLFLDPEGRKRISAPRVRYKDSSRERRKVVFGHVPTTEENLQRFRERAGNRFDELMGEAFTGVESDEPENRNERRKSLRIKYKGWVTMEPSGTHVYIEGGKVEAGPSSMEGKPISGDKPDGAERKRPVESPKVRRSKLQKDKRDGSSLEDAKRKLDKLPQIEEDGYPSDQKTGMVSTNEFFRKTTKAEMTAVVLAMDYLWEKDQKESKPNSQEEFVRRHGREQEVSIEDLGSTQPNIETDKVIGLLENEERLSQQRERDYPVVVKSGGKLYAWDGQHRIVAQSLVGKSKIRAFVVDLDKKQDG